MRVVHLSPTFFHPDSVVGGGERYVNNVAGAIAAAAAGKGRSVTQKVVALGRNPGDIDQAWGRLQILRNEAGDDNLMGGYSGKIKAALVGADVVHVHQSLTDFGAYGLAVAKSLRIPTVTTDLGGGANESMLQGGGLELSDAVVSISQFARKDLGPYYQGEHRVIVGPVDTGYFSPGQTVVRQGAATVLCVGRIMPHKGVDRIIKALPPGMRLRVVGNVYHRKYRGVLRRLAFGKDVEFIEKAGDEELLGYYRSADVLVQASTHLDYFGDYHAKPELMGLTTLEALSCGLPAIVSDAASLPELASDPDFSLVFKDVDDLRAKLSAVKDSTWPRTRCPERMNRHVTERHGIISCGTAFLELYAHVSGRRDA